MTVPQLPGTDHRWTRGGAGLQAGLRLGTGGVHQGGGGGRGVKRGGRGGENWCWGWGTFSGATRVV